MLQTFFGDRNIRFVRRNPFSAAFPKTYQQNGITIRKKSV